MLSFSISYPDLTLNNYFVIPLKEGFGGERRSKDTVTIWITLVFTLNAQH
jgi:hypothetical protein